MEKKDILIFIIFLLFLNSVSAAFECEFTIPTVKQNTCVELVQTCANCSGTVNLTAVFYPQSNGTIIYPNVIMTQNQNNYNYTFCDTNEIGVYIYSTLGFPNGIPDTASVCFEVTPLGDNLSGSQSALYFIPLFVFGFLVFFLGHRFFVSPTITSKSIYFLLTIIFGLLPLTYSIYNLTNNYLSAQEFLINVLYYFFMIQLFLLPIIFVVCVGYIIVDLVNNSAKKKLIKRGYDDDAAERRIKRK